MIGDQREINYQFDKYQMIDREIDDKYTVNDTQAEQKNELMSERIGEKRGLQKPAFLLRLPRMHMYVSVGLIAED